MAALRLVHGSIVHIRYFDTEGNVCATTFEHASYEYRC